jgi:hypothetical protein
MWTKTKSAILSLVCTRVLIGIAIAIAITLPFLAPDSIIKFPHFISSLVVAGIAGPFIFVGLPLITVKAIYICAYSTIVFAMIALFSLDGLLRNIRKESIFIRINVKYLRLISWCCFAIAVIMICSWPHIHLVLIFVSAAAAFFGLLVRVIKNVIDAACEIKDENDYTI